MFYIYICTHTYMPNICWRGNTVNIGSEITDRRYECRTRKIVNIKELQMLIRR